MCLVIQSTVRTTATVNLTNSKWYKVQPWSRLNSFVRWLLWVYRRGELMSSPLIGIRYMNRIFNRKRYSDTVRHLHDVTVTSSWRHLVYRKLSLPVATIATVRTNIPLMEAVRRTCFPSENACQFHGLTTYLSYLWPFTHVTFPVLPSTFSASWGLFCVFKHH